MTIRLATTADLAVLAGNDRHITPANLLDDYRGKGYGRQLVEHWEWAMAEVGHKRVMTSTQSDEFAQHFYQHMGYCVIGGFLMGDDPYEVILVKDIG